MKEADVIAEKKRKEVEKILAPITNKETQQKTIRKEVLKYTKPASKVWVGLIATLVSGVLDSVFGFLVVNNLFAMMNPDIEEMKSQSHFWSLIIFGLAFVYLGCFWFSKSNFGYVGEHISKNVRIDLYTTVLRKHIGWHDDPLNASGVLTATLAWDV
jgi:ABC-type multidrug transport system fused ATPase/permease subunit